MPREERDSEAILPVAGRFLCPFYGCELAEAGGDWKGWSTTTQLNVHCQKWHPGARRFRKACGRDMQGSAEDKQQRRREQNRTAQRTLSKKRRETRQARLADTMINQGDAYIQERGSSLAEDEQHSTVQLRVVRRLRLAAHSCKEGSSDPQKQRSKSMTSGALAALRAVARAPAAPFTQDLIQLAKGFVESSCAVPNQGASSSRGPQLPSPGASQQPRQGRDPRRSLSPASTSTQHNAAKSTSKSNQKASRLSNAAAAEASGVATSQGVLAAIAASLKTGISPQLPQNAATGAPASRVIMHPGLLQAPTIKGRPPTPAALGSAAAVIANAFQNGVTVSGAPQAVPTSANGGSTMPVGAGGTGLAAWMENWRKQLGHLETRRAEDLANFTKLRQTERDHAAAQATVYRSALQQQANSEAASLTKRMDAFSSDLLDQRVKDNQAWRECLLDMDTRIATERQQMTEEREKWLSLIASMQQQQQQVQAQPSVVPRAADAMMVDTGVNTLHEGVREGDAEVATLTARLAAREAELQSLRTSHQEALQVNEEAVSVVERLKVVNQGLQRNVAELTQANSDLTRKCKDLAKGKMAPMPHMPPGLASATRQRDALQAKLQAAQQRCVFLEGVSKAGEDALAIKAKNEELQAQLKDLKEALEAARPACSPPNPSVADLLLSITQSVVSKGRASRKG
ncbi:hypothetical protein WJX73_009322 [Symbiochloris irregularis]|uniref:BZIP domain-containing protein n=1 Tax=Symbiochloris irregularis TaxID=706552 RepID=A0AAW1PI32_9CHLO